MGEFQPLCRSATSSNGRVHASTTTDGITTSSEPEPPLFLAPVSPERSLIRLRRDFLQQQEQQMMYAQQQQQAMQAQYAQQQAYEEHMRQQQMLYAQQLAQSQQPVQPLQPQATGFGANNPFAAFASSSSPAPTPAPQQQQQQQAPLPPREPSPPLPVPQPSMTPQRTGPRFRSDGDSKHGELAKMLAGGREDGLDTFGNIGSSRVPVWQQKTGQQQGGGGQSMVPQMTGLAKPNPFGASGYKAPTQFNQPTGYGQHQQQQQQQNVSLSLSLLGPKPRLSR